MGGAELIDRAADNFFEGDCLPADDAAPPDSEAERCRQLFCAVIQQALADARGIGAIDAGVGDQEEARRFLLSDLQPWRGDREAICDLADFDAEKVRAGAERLLRPLIRGERKLAWDRERNARYQKAHRARVKSGAEPSTEQGRRIVAGRALAKAMTPEQRKEYQRLRDVARNRALRARQAAQSTGNRPDKADAALARSPALSASIAA